MKPLLKLSFWMILALMGNGMVLNASVQRVLPASQESIQIGTFRFRIVSVTLDETALGLAPADLETNEQILMVEFELLAGDKYDFLELDPLAEYNQNGRTRPILLMSQGMIKILTPVTVTGKTSNFRPKDDSVVWVYVAPKGEHRVVLHFPSHEILDLTPLLK